MESNLSFSSTKLNTIAYTIVTPNYLAHAWSLKKSFLLHNPNAAFFICLIGNPNDYPDVNQKDIFFIQDLKDNRIDGMLRRYNAFELSCALKPFFAEHILQVYASVNRLIYLDGDMYVFGPFKQLSTAAITISVHRSKNISYLPGDDNFSVISLNRYGVYNAGYFELQRKEEAFAFIHWWKHLMETKATDKPDEHLFTDQLWLSAVPSFFDDVYINKHPGYNVGFWNFIERNVEEKEGVYYVNEEPLVLFHFSKYKVEKPDELVDFSNQFLSFHTFPHLKPLYNIYRQGILQEKYDEVKSLPYPFAGMQTKEKKNFWRKLIP